MWIPDKMALRAGTAVGTEWNATNVGTHSLAIGNEVTAFGNYSVSLGLKNLSWAGFSFTSGEENVVQLLANHGVAMGWQNQVISPYSVALGVGNIAGSIDAESEGCVALGDQNQALGHDTFAVGEYCVSDGQASVGLGYSNDVLGFASAALGRDNQIGSNVGGESTACVASVAAGCCNIILSDNCGTYGNKNSIPADFDNSHLFGSYLKAGSANTMVLGNGIDGNPLLNNIANSLMVGFNSDLPTLFIETSSGVGTFGRVGVGVTDPTARFDVNGTARLRVMPTTEDMDVIITGVQQDALGDYELNYLEMGEDSEVLAGDGTWIDLNDAACEWNEVTNVTDDLVMGYGGACNEGNVGIGLAAPTSKLHIVNTVNTTNSTVRVESTGNNGATVGHYGIDSQTNGGGDFQVAVNGEAAGTFNLDPSDPVQPLIGVRGIARAFANCGHQAIGIYGEAFGNTCSPAFAAYFVGSVSFAGGSIFLSDQAIKMNVEAYSGGLEAIMALQPKTYNINPEVMDYANPEELNYGFIAQEVQEVLPDLVAEVMAPLDHDEEGNLIASEETYLGIRYTELIPVLVSAIQEQQAQIEALSAQVSACCAIDAEQRTGAIPPNDIRIEQSANRLDQNIPNPFDTNTRIGFNLANDCRVSICIYNSAGQQIDCLIDEFRTSGMHNVEWNTSTLAKGLYFYSLETDGFEQVRRAVKL